MADLSFSCTDIVPERYAAGPTLNIHLQISERTGVPVHTLALYVQIRIEPVRRRYAPAEVEKLNDLFGTPDRWGDTLRAMQLATISTMVSGFTGTTNVVVPLPVTFDTEVASSKYFTALDDGEIPLLLLFSGTAFVRSESGAVAVDPVPWDRESTYRMPVAAWHELMEAYFGGSSWLQLGRPTLEALGRFRTERALTSWDDTFAHLLKEAGAALP